MTGLFKYEVELSDFGDPDAIEPETSDTGKRYDDARTARVDAHYAVLEDPRWTATVHRLAWDDELEDWVRDDWQDPRGGLVA